MSLLLLYVEQQSYATDLGYCLVTSLRRPCRVIKKARNESTTQDQDLLGKFKKTNKVNSLRMEEQLRVDRMCLSSVVASHAGFAGFNFSLGNLLLEQTFLDWFVPELGTCVVEAKNLGHDNPPTPKAVWKKGSSRTSHYLSLQSTHNDGLAPTDRVDTWAIIFHHASTQHDGLCPTTKAIYGPSCSSHLEKVMGFILMQRAHGPSFGHVLEVQCLLFCAAGWPFTSSWSCGPKMRGTLQTS